MRRSQWRRPPAALKAVARELLDLVDDALRGGGAQWRENVKTEGRGGWVEVAVAKAV